LRRAAHGVLTHFLVYFVQVAGLNRDVETIAEPRQQGNGELNNPAPADTGKIEKFAA